MPDGSLLAKTNAKGTPVPPVNDDRRGEILHYYEGPAAHVAPVGLKQKRLSILRDFAYRTVIEYAPIAAIGCIPLCIRSLRMPIVWIVSRQITSLGPRNTEDDAGIGFLQRILDRRQNAVGKRDIVREILLGVRTGNRPVALV